MSYTTNLYTAVDEDDRDILIIYDDDVQVAQILDPYARKNVISNNGGLSAEKIDQLIARHIENTA